MASPGGEKPYRLYRGGRTKGRVPTVGRPERASSRTRPERDGRSRYEEASDTHHDHLINLRTGEVIEFQSEEIEKLQREVARRLGYRLVDHRLELYAVPLTDEKARR